MELFQMFWACYCDNDDDDDDDDNNNNNILYITY